MLRRASLCLALSILMLAPACRKNDEGEAEGDAARAKKIEDTDKAGPAEPPAKQEPAPTPTPTPTPTPVAPSGDSGATPSADSGGGGGKAATPRDDLSCDPEEKGACLEGEQCVGGQGCDAVWTCDADIVCKKGVKEYCGCDGRTFEAVYGNCPWKKYEYPGPCK